MFKNKSFLKLLDLTPEEIGALLDLAADLPTKPGNWLFKILNTLRRRDGNRN